MDCFGVEIPSEGKLDEDLLVSALQRASISELGAIDTYAKLVKVLKHNKFSEDFIKEIEEIRIDELDHFGKLLNLWHKLRPDDAKTPEVNIDITIL